MDTRGNRLAQAALIAALVAMPGCASTDYGKALSNAAKVKAGASVSPKLPDLHASCTALVHRVRPKVADTHVVTQKAWEASATNRDNQSAVCAAWWNTYRNVVEKTGTTQ